MNHRGHYDDGRADGLRGRHATPPCDRRKAEAYRQGYDAGTAQRNGTEALSVAEKTARYDLDAALLVSGHRAINQGVFFAEDENLFTGPAADRDGRNGRKSQ